MRNKVLFSLIGLAVVAQVFQPDRTAPTSDAAADLITMTRPSSHVADVLHKACYDCHSNATTYPWYARITPVNFWLQHHINEGREEFNMNAWGTKSAKWRDHKKKDAIRELEKNEMPLDSYTWIHTEARLSEADRDSLVAFFKGL